MAHIRTQPIGIFDSGIGGMTIAHAVAEAMPHERMIYFGDTAHLPYGDKSTAAIQAYSVKICDVLLKQQVKAILIACNSASAAAYELVKEYVGSRAKVMNVIDPIVDDVASRFSQQTVGLIGTKQTVSSNVYLRKLDDRNTGVRLQSLATPLLAPMIEEGFYNNTISQSIIDNYLQQPELAGIKALILGCTHYPLIKQEIADHYQHQHQAVEVIDASVIVAQRFKQMLADHDLLTDATAEPQHHFYVSDYTDSFKASTAIFFRRPVQLELYRLWE